MFTVCVFCGSREGSDPRFADSAYRFGEVLADRGWRLVYGGAQVGLMGRVAKAVLDNGGTVKGIIPEILNWPEARWERVEDMEVVPNLTVRKFRMMEESDAFVALPGGVGTVDEIFELAAAKQLRMDGMERKPVLILNMLGYFDPLKEMLDGAIRNGFLDRKDSGTLEFVPTVGDMTNLLEAASGQ